MYGNMKIKEARRSLDPSVYVRTIIPFPRHGVKYTRQTLNLDYVVTRRASAAFLIVWFASYCLNLARYQIRAGTSPCDQTAGRMLHKFPALSVDKLLTWRGGTPVLYPPYVQMYIIADTAFQF